MNVCVTLGGDSWRQVHDRERLTGTLYPPRTVHLPPGLGHDGNRWSSSGRRGICPGEQRNRTLGR